MANVEVFLDGVVPGKETELLPRLAKLFKRDEAAIRPVLTRCPFRLIKDVDEAKAQQLKQYLEQFGAVIRIQGDEQPPLAVDEDLANATMIMNQPLKADSAVSEPSPSAASPSVDTPADPYSPPASDVDAARPMAGVTNPDTPPKPLGFARRVRLCLDFMKRNFGVILGIGILSVLINFGSQFLVVGMAFLKGGGVESLQGPNVASPLGILGQLLAVVGMLVMTWQQSLFTALPDGSLKTGAKANFKAVARQAFERGPTLLWLSLLLMILPAVVFGLLASFVGVALGQAGAFVIIGLMILMIPFYLLLSLAGPVVVHEQISAIKAIPRAWRLTAGRRGMVIGNYLLLFLILFVFLIVLVLILAGLGMLLGQNPVLQIVFGVVIYFLMFIFGFALFLSFASLLYFEARVLDESYAPDWEEVPDLSWPADPANTLTLNGPGLKGWIVVTVIGLVFLVGLPMGLRMLGGT